MATQVGIPFQGWSFSSQDQSQESGDGLVKEMLDHGSISFGQYAMESLSWEKHSVFSHDTRQEELDKLTYPGLVAKKKAYFEEYYKRIRALKALEEEKATNTENALESLTEHIEIDPLNDKIAECEVNTSKFCVSEVVMQEELDKNESTEEIPFQSVLGNTTNMVEQGMKSSLNSHTLCTSCVTEVAYKKDVYQIESGNPLQPVGRMSTDEIEHEMKSTLGSDTLDTSFVTEDAMQKDMHQIESGIVNPFPLVRRKSADKVEHEKKLKQDFDSLSKDWVKLKKGMASIGGNERDESVSENKNCKVASAVNKSSGAVKDTTISHKNVLRQKVHKSQIKSFKEVKQPSQKVNSRDTKSLHLRKLGTGGRVASKTRPNSLLSRDKPLTRAKSSLSNLKESSRVRSKNMEKLSSNPNLTKGKSTRRSSLDSLMKPTASSNARSIKSDVKRSSSVPKKPLPSCVPKVLKRDASQRRFSNVHAQDKLRHTRSDRARPHMATKNSFHRNKPQQAKIELTNRKRVEPKKVLDLKARSKKLVAPKEVLPSYKRTKQNEDSPLKKRRRHEKPPWR